jgi:cytochrome c peroxidase
METVAFATSRAVSARCVPWNLARKTGVALLSGVGFAGVLLASGASWAVNPAAPPPLNTLEVPRPPSGAACATRPAGTSCLSDFIKDEAAAIRLGKALFWDMQVGSDGVQSCATCHFQAGADNRPKNSISPGLKSNPPDTTFQVVGPNGTLTPTMFPFRLLSDPMNRSSTPLRDSDDVASSQGIHATDFVGIRPGNAVEIGDTSKLTPDPMGFSVGGVNVRRVEPRNAPTVINAVFNFDNFWDGRAKNTFNGVNPFGDLDANARIYRNVNGTCTPEQIHLVNSSLASQAVGPPGSDFEMSFAGRTFPNIGRKLLSLVPLGKQRVHPQDSMLGSLSRAKLRRNGAVVGRSGLNTSYTAMIQAAFQDNLWNCTQPISFGNSAPLIVNDGPRRLVVSPGTARVLNRAPAPLPANTFTQMEANFSLFFGLAVQEYEATLVSDDTPFDRFQAGDDSAMTLDQQLGLQIFLQNGGGPGVIGGGCINCHSGTEFTNESVANVQGAAPFGELPETAIERMIMGDGSTAFYDRGFYNIGVRPTEEDIGRGGNSPFSLPDGTPLPLSHTRAAKLIDSGEVLPFTPPGLPCGGVVGGCTFGRDAIEGSFKVPTIRNVELTGPYFHNGGQATLMQTLDHYVRGGDFHEHNIADLAPDIEFLSTLAASELQQNRLVDFMLALTDERVRWEQAPFDHPELFIPNGNRGTAQQLGCGNHACDEMIKIPAVGAGGRKVANLPPLGTFLGLDPHAAP